MCERISDDLLKVLMASKLFLKHNLQMDLLLDDAANIFAYGVTLDAPRLDDELHPLI